MAQVVACNNLQAASRNRARPLLKSQPSRLEAEGNAIYLGRRRLQSAQLRGRAWHCSRKGEEV